MLGNVLSRSGIGVVTTAVTSWHYSKSHILDTSTRQNFLPSHRKIILSQISDHLHSLNDSLVKDNFLDGANLSTCQCDVL